MNRNIKIFFVSLCGVLFLLIIAAFLLPIFFNPKYHKTSVESYISSVIGLPCSLGGRFEFTLIPQAAITFSELTIGEVGRNDKAELLFFESGQVVMSPWPLLKGKAEIKRIMLSGVRARFEENSQGVKNWSKLTNINSSLTIGLLVITDGDVVIIRKPSNRKYHYSDMSLVLSDYAFGESSGVETEGLLNNLALKFDGRIKAIKGDNQGHAKITCKGDLSLRESEESSVFIGRVSGDINFPEGVMDLSLIPHAVNKNNRDSMGPLVQQLFEIKGPLSEPSFFLAGQPINQQDFSISLKEGDNYLLDTKVIDLVERLSGLKIDSRNEEIGQVKLESVGVVKKNRGSIKIGIMQIQ